ncbi:alpha/beta hydrolase [Nocardioides zeae]|uniref:Alpha/beta hydrolase n=1 Tax=Nocardioides imazamoxiresistens TaxID=3231893 RepID=A0ABU3PXE3_9ACTN|nr:alpha/beta hydrolase [Nocardioides zeae]MDT9593917.1 alpha/beta hydrolase [Nocardioides zeae]
MTTISADGVHLHHTDTGGAGRPVVLIHGWPLSGESWEHQVPALTGAGYRVVTYDRRGFGGSDKPETGYDYDTLASDLDAVLTQLDLTDVTLVGFSMGGGEVARYLGTHGSERVRAAVFAAAVPPYLLKSDDNPDGGLTEEDVQGFVDGVTNDREGFLDGFTTDFFSVDGTLAVSEDERRKALELEKSATPASLAGCVNAFARTDFRDDLARIGVPTLVIHGSADATVPYEVSGQRTGKAVSQAEIVVVKDAPHGFNVSHAEKFNAALLDFLGRS